MLKHFPAITPDKPKGNMHYRNGRPAKNGDKVVYLPVNGDTPVAGIIYDIVSENDMDFSSGRIAIPAKNDPCPNLKDCLHADDIRNASIPVPDEFALTGAEPVYNPAAAAPPVTPHPQQA